MKFGIFDHLDRNELPMAQYYEERLKLVELYDRTGFHAYHVAEHQSTPVGRAPSPASSARRRFCRRPISSTASTSTATAMSICATACRMFWLRRRIC